jgi:DNA-binding XRE family transcriptional regulator
MRVSSKTDLLPFQAEEVLRTLAGRIKMARLVLGYTQPDLAAKAGISTNTLLKMEKGSASVQLGFWLQVLWALDLLDGFNDALEQLCTTAAMVSIMEESLPKRARGPRRTVLSKEARK